MEDKYKGLYGFKNNAPAYTNSAGVQLFIDTWGFLPNSTNILEKLDKSDLIELCLLTLDASCSIDLEGKNIKVIQRVMNDLDVSPNKLNNNICQH